MLIATTEDKSTIFIGITGEEKEMLIKYADENNTTLDQFVGKAICDAMRLRLNKEEQSC
jgi:uncharacterized protein (DUF1778 family)